jgi:hypothetical protein
MELTGVSYFNAYGGQGPVPRIGMGDFNTDVSAITPLASVVGQSIAQSIAAANPAYPYPYGAAPAGSSGFSLTGIGTISPWVLLAVAGVMAVLLIKK